MRLVVVFLVAAVTASTQQPTPQPDTGWRRVDQPAAQQPTPQQRATAAPEAAPAQANEPTFQGGVDVVNVFCTVRTKQGGLVGTLTKDDFEVSEDGKPQTIKYFTRETDLPLTIGLLIDVSRSQERLIEEEKQAASQFFTQVLGKKDLAFLISFGSEAELLQDYTSSARLLRHGLDGLKVNAPPPQVTESPVPTVYTARGTILYDAVYLAAHDELHGQVGRKVIVLITDGNDEGSRLKIEDAMRSAQLSDAIIYGIDYYDPRAYGGGFGFGGGGGEGVLRRMSEETGGRMFRVSGRHPLSEAFEQIQRDMRTQYAIGYLPTNSKKDGSFRKIDIKTHDKDQKVQARKGYYAVPPEQS
jgi:VWFA-related protein